MKMRKSQMQTCLPETRSGNKSALPPSRRFFRGYLVIGILKSDDRGSVLKCIRLNRLFNMEWCLLKQGLLGESKDDNGRDMANRLRWQHDLQSRLSGHLPVPGALHFFEYDGGVFLASRFLEGMSLGMQMTALNAGSCLRGLDETRQLIIRGYILQVLSIIAGLHNLGLVHRDLNSENFMVDADGKIWVIDLELCYDMITRRPTPPFTLGTPGYMSPEQQAAAVPDTPEDVYGFGALLIRLLTGFSPAKFDSQPQRLRKQLHYLLADPALAKLVASCLELHPAARPDLAIITAHFSINFPLPVQTGMKGRENTGSIQARLKYTIPAALKSLMSPGLAGETLLWYRDNTGMEDRTAAVLRLVAAAAQAGYHPDGLDRAADINFSAWTKRLSRTPGERETGLLSGTAGWAVTLVELHQAGLVTSGFVRSGSLQEYLFEEPAEELGLKNGLAGHGLAILKCLPYLQPAIAVRSLRNIADRLLQLQQPDGSWLISAPGAASRGVKLPGLYHGIAGIAWFLIAMDSVLNYAPARAGAERALAYLKAARSLAHNDAVWTVNPFLPAVDPWLEDGFTGVAWVFIQASEHYGNEEYRQVAERALHYHPEYIVSDYLDMDSGLAGLGQVYLDAARAFGGELWQKRANWIAGLFAHMTRETDDICLWINGRGHEAMPRLSDQCGILQFLLAYCHSEKTPFLFTVKMPESCLN